MQMKAPDLPIPLLQEGRKNSVIMTYTITLLYSSQTFSCVTLISWPLGPYNGIIIILIVMFLC